MKPGMQWLAGAIGVLLVTGSAAAGVKAADANHVRPTTVLVPAAAPAPAPAPAATVAPPAPAPAPQQINVKASTARSVFDGPTLTVTGTGRIPATPDVLRLSVGVTVSRPTVKDAVNGANAAAGRVIKALKDNGVADKDLQTNYVNVMDQWDNTGHRSGFNATNTLTARLRDIPKAGAVMAAVVDAGGDDVRLQGLSFDLEDNKGPMAEARQAAMDDARGKAEDLARLSGRKLGRVLAVDDNSRSMAPSMPYTTGYAGSAGMAADSAASPVPVQPGQLDTLFRVTVVYELD